MNRQFSAVVKYLGSIFMAGMLLHTALAQDVDYPRPSPTSSVMQVVGITEVSVEYSSPAVKGRTIWGDLVPYGEMWRTGANAATKISFSTDVKINGQELAAGSYSLFTLPGEKEWGVMFNTRTDIGGTDYQPDADAVKLSVKPEAGPHRERMAFLIENNTNDGADIVLHWEKLRLVLKLQVSTHELVMAAAAKAVEQSWSPSFQAAQYILGTDADHERGLEYAMISTGIKETYWNTRVRAQLHARLDQKDAAIQTMSRAVELGKAMENEPFDFQQMQGLLAEWQGKM